jgi:hypothetical protein
MKHENLGLGTARSTTNEANVFAHEAERDPQTDNPLSQMLLRMDALQRKHREAMFA